MEGQLQAYLILGCNGFTERDGFVHCTGAVNHVLDLSKIEAGTYGRVVNFFENACDLFENPMYNYNKCCNTLVMLHRDFGVIAHENLLSIQKFLRMHRECGVCLVLMMKEDYDNE